MRLKKGKAMDKASDRSHQDGDSLAGDSSPERSNNAEKSAPDLLAELRRDVASAELDDKVAAFDQQRRLDGILGGMDSGMVLQQKELFADADAREYDMGPAMVLHKVNENDSKQKRLVSFSPDYNLDLGCEPQGTPSPTGKLDGGEDAADGEGHSDLNLLGSGGRQDGHGSSLPQFGGQMLLHGGQISEIREEQDRVGEVGGHLGPEPGNADGRGLQYARDGSKRSPHNRNKPVSNDFAMKYLNNADAEAPHQKETNGELSISYPDGGVDGDSRDLSHDQTLIWALRKELAAKTKLISELKNQESQQREQPGSASPLPGEASIESRSPSPAVDGSAREQLHQIYEQKLAEALDREREQVRVEFESQLESQVAAVREQSTQMIELRTNEI